MSSSPPSRLDFKSAFAGMATLRDVAGQAAQVFVARLSKEWRTAGGTPAGAGRTTALPAHCVVTEGEFKACALYWVFEGKVGVAALPGISQSKNYTVLEELKEWLREECRPEKLAVAFDNEDKILV